MDRSFYDRLGLSTNLSEGRDRFMNRVDGYIFSVLKNKLGLQFDELFIEICKKLGEKVIEYQYDDHIIGMRCKGFIYLAKGDFHKTLRILEKIYGFKKIIIQRIYNFDLDSLIKQCLDDSVIEDNIDLGIRFRGGLFYSSGDDELDINIIDQSLNNIKGFKSKTYYNTCLKNYLTGDKKGAIEDCYETLEKLSQEILGNDKNLKSNKEAILQYFGGDGGFAKQRNSIINILYDYLNDHRHTRSGKTNDNIDDIEVESTIYMTGLLINLIINKYTLINK